MTDSLARAFPTLASLLPKLPLADLPTPVSTQRLTTPQGRRDIAIKHDDVSGELYGGNKVRKLEYLLQRARERGADRVATFGTVASNHALATALYSKVLGLQCTCLLSHQTRTASAPRILNIHLQNSTEIVRYGGNRASRIQTLRQRVQGRNTWVIPPGGSCWLGAVGFVNAGLELAEQCLTDECDVPDRIYVANGTMATAAGLALGTALAGLRTEVHAVRVTEDFVANPEKMRRLLAKTAVMLARLDPSVPEDLAEQARLVFREGFLGEGYAKSTPETDRAIDTARAELGLQLESTYTGKAMAALLHDIGQPELAELSIMFWNTYNSRPLPADAERPDDVSGLPEEFLRYYE